MGDASLGHLLSEVSGDIVVGELILACLLDGADGGHVTQISTLARWPPPRSAIHPQPWAKHLRTEEGRVTTSLIGNLSRSDRRIRRFQSAEEINIEA